MHWSNRRCIVLFFSSVICLLPGSTITAQQRPVAPPDISKWDLICFCITSVYTAMFARHQSNLPPDHIHVARSAQNNKEDFA